MSGDTLEVLVKIGPTAFDRNAVRFLVHLNGEAFAADVAVDAAALVSAGLHTGEHAIFTCDCGEPLCARIYRGIVSVVDAMHVRWLVPDPVAHDASAELSDVLPRFRFVEYEFAADDYFAAIVAALRQALAIAARLDAPSVFVPHGLAATDVVAALGTAEAHAGRTVHTGAR